MKNHRFRRILSLVLVAALLAGFYVPGVQAASTGLSWKETDQRINHQLANPKEETAPQEDRLPSEPVRVSIVLEDKSTIQAGYSTRNISRNGEALAYGSRLQAKQEALAQTISAQVLGGKKLDVVWNLTLAANLISARVPYGTIDAISQIEGVKAVILEKTYTPCVVNRDEVAQPQMFASLAMTGSSLTWANGFTGAGSRIAIVDTGTDTNHQSLDSGAFLYALKENAESAGKSYSSYVQELDLLDAQEIASVLSLLNINDRISNLTAAKLYLNEKLPFAANYVDGNLTVDHEHDYQSEHGSHVAGIAAANRYIPGKGGSYADALTSVLVAGVAPDAQLLTMKVFGASGGPSDADYLAAVEDAIYLGCDSVNLSLGTSVSGDGFNDYFSELLNYLTQTDTVVVASAGNSGAWTDTTIFGYPYANDVNLDTVGAPGSYNSFFTVASVNNDGGVGYGFQAQGHTAMYDDAVNSTNRPLTTLDISTDGTGTDYNFVFIDGLGYPEDYQGIDLSGKIVFCSRGDLNFAVKANNAADLGASATIVYNNEPGGFGMDLTGYSYTRPCASIAQADADAIRSASQKHTTSGGITYYTGKITIYAKEQGIPGNAEYYTMSNFSSWGVPGGLTLKPEITAPGGLIYSLYGEALGYGGGPDQYEVMSGTSMAAPAITGMAALLGQYIREKGLDTQEGISPRDLAHSLLMSTAVPIREEDSGGNYYSLLKQGAGLARPDLATLADSYILVDGQTDGKVKAELGDDPNRTGVYEFSFSINNLTDKAQTYTLRADAFRQDVFEYQPGSEVFLLDTWTVDLPASAQFYINGASVNQGGDLSRHDLNGDGTTNALDADYLLEYLLGNVTILHGEADVSGDGYIRTYDAHLLLAMVKNGTSGVTVPAGGSVTVDVRLELTAEGRRILNEGYPNGTFVEAFVYAESVSDEEGVAGTSHSIPVLAFYGNWTDPNMFDYSSALEMHYGQAVDAPYLYRITGSAVNGITVDYGDGGEYYFGANPYVDDEVYLPQRSAFNSQNASTLYGQYFTLLRNASAAALVISNAETGEVYKSIQESMLTPAYYHVNMGSWQDIEQGIRINWRGTDASGKALPENTLVDVTLTAAPEYYRNADGSHNWEELGTGASLSTQFYIDNTSPTITDWSLDGTTLTVKARDNRYVAAVLLANANGSTIFAAESPNQTQLNAPVTLELDLSMVVGKNFLLVVCDYAGNETSYEVSLDLPEIERPYFTALDCTTGYFVGLDQNANSINLAPINMTSTPRAAAYAEGYLFIVTDDHRLWVANDEDLSTIYPIAQLDPENKYQIANMLDMAYDHSSGTMYCLYYSELNNMAVPYLAAIDLTDGSMESLCQMPVDVHTLAMDESGNFYSMGYGSGVMYTYTLANALSGKATTVGSNYYSTTQVCSMTWDPVEDRLYYLYPSTLLRIDPKTAEPTLLGYFNNLLVGLYVRTPSDSVSPFDPVNTVTDVELNLTEGRCLEGYYLDLEADVWPWNAANHSVTWRSSNTAVATVNGEGLVTGVSVGTAVITATSVLDPSKTAQCVVTVEAQPDKTLNAIIWDEAGYVWMSRFSTASLPNYTPLGSDIPVPLGSAAMDQNGNIYAATLDISTMRSELYQVDPVTYAPTFIGASTDAYMDLAPAPGVPGNSLMAVYGNYVLYVDTATGDYYEWYDLFANYLVGIAYAGTEAYQNGSFDTLVDWYFLIDQAGYVYLLGFLEQDGIYYYMEHDVLAPGGLYTSLGFEMDVPFFGSAYFDGEYLYFSAYRESEGNVTLLAVDVAGGTRSCYNLGTFADNVWPVAGLMELGGSYFPAIQSAPTTAQPQKLETAATAPVLEVEVPDVMRKGAAPSQGSLNAIPSDVVMEPQSEGEFDENNDQVIVTLTGANQRTGSTNGRMTVSYNPDELKLVSVTGTTEAFAYTLGQGSLEVAHASASTLSVDTPVAILTFQVLKPGEHQIVVHHLEDGDEPSGKEEYLTVISGCSHSYSAVVTEPTCQAGGYTTYTCTNCGDNYISDYTDPVDHVYVDGYCKWCGQGEQYLRWYSGTTSLNGTIDLNIYVLLSQDLVNDPNTFVRFTYDGNVVDVPMADAQHSPTAQNPNRYRFSCPIYAKQLADKVNVVFMKGNTQIGKALSYSVVQYCENQIKKVTDPQELALYKAMLNYGAAAQQMFSHNLENLANASLSDADKVLPSVDASAYKYSISGSEVGIKAKSATLMLEDVVKVRVYFTLTGAKYIEDYTFTIDGKVVTPQYNDKGWYVETDGIAAKDLEKMFSVQVGGITVKYGALSFVNSKANGSNVLEANISKALYVYWQAADSYLG